MQMPPQPDQSEEISATSDEHTDKTASGEGLQRRESSSAMADVTASPCPPCDARSLAPAADRIAQGVSSVASVFSAKHQKSRLRLYWDHIKPVLVAISIAVGGAFALEQYLASQYEAAKASIEVLLSSSSDALGTSGRVLQANAVRTLPRIGEFSTYSMPTGVSSVGRHLIATLGRFPKVYPYFDQSWLLFRDVATAPREISDRIVSTAILREGAAWEHRIRQGEKVPNGWAGGSLLYQAQLAGASANSIDLRGIQFAASDLTGADLSGSDCTA